MVYRMYQDVQGYWRWRFYAANNRIVADSGEGYHNRQDCRNGIEIMKRSASAPVQEG